MNTQHHKIFPALSCEGFAFQSEKDTKKVNLSPPTRDRLQPKTKNLTTKQTTEWSLLENYWLRSVFNRLKNGISNMQYGPKKLRSSPQTFSFLIVSLSFNMLYMHLKVFLTSHLINSVNWIELKVLFGLVKDMMTSAWLAQLIHMGGEQDCLWFDKPLIDIVSRMMWQHYK